MANEGDDCRRRYPAIGAYALVGDCHTAALISNQGSVDWYCPGRFDAPAACCRLLDARQGGFFRVAPVGKFTSHRQYQGPTAILETTFTRASARARLTDFMPVHHRHGAPHGEDTGTSRRLLRLLEGLNGEMEIEVCFNPTFDYARQRAHLSVVPGKGVVARGDGRHLFLDCPGARFEPAGEAGVRATLRLTAGQRRWIALVDTLAGAADDRLPDSDDPEHQLEQTRDYWRDWAGACTYRGPYRDQVLRSALTIKLLTYEPTGAIVAAPTTSLPEQIGGARNWDYRYSWLRDSTMMLYALITIGYHREARDFFGWLRRTSGSDSERPPQIMYGIDGRRDLDETTLDQLEGYCCSRPVRIGNGAAHQRQLDVYGEVLTAAYLRFRAPGAEGDPWREDETEPRARRPSARGWAFLSNLVEQVVEHWQEPDCGIWEVRGDPRQFVYSKLMCWAAVDRGIRLAVELGLDAPLARWRSIRAQLRRAIIDRGYNQDLGSFVQSFGSQALDASVLAIPRLGFLPPTDHRVRSTVEQIRNKLTRDGLVYRYLNEDGVTGTEATFALCTFWLVDALALGGKVEEAHDLFERVVADANDVGLLAEEIDPKTGDILGNFPQGFTHLALIGSAVNLAKSAKHGPEESAETEAHRAGQAHQAAAEGHSVRPQRRSA